MRFYIIDDDACDVDTIEMIMRRYSIKESDIRVINPFKKQKITNVVEEILEGVENNDVGLVIFDYFFETDDKSLNGTMFYKKIREEVENLPLVILTNLKPEVDKLHEIDRDKIYSKRAFFSDRKYQDEKVITMISNRDKYRTLKIEYLEKRDVLIFKMKENSFDEETYKSLLEVSSKLSRLNPKRGIIVDDFVTVEKLSEIGKIIKDAEGILKDE